MSNITQDVIVINEGFQERRRTTSTGTKSRYTYTVDAEPILFNLSEEKMSEGPALAIGAAIKKQIMAIMDVAKPSTIKRRQSAKRQLDGDVAGKYKENVAKFGRKAVKSGEVVLGNDGRATLKRYSGGRMGAMPPTGSVRLFNDSGRLAEGVFVRQNTQERNWTVNVPANRMDPSTFRDRGAFLAMVERFQRYVTVLREPTKDRDFVQAITDGFKEWGIRVLDKDANVSMALRRSVMNVSKQFLSLFLP